MHIVIFIFEIIGTVAFAVSGTITALKKGMDLFGVVILGLTTAVGGGVLRDLLLGITPPATFRSPVYAAVAIAASMIMFFLFGKRALENPHIFESGLLLIDALGLGVFTVLGVEAAYLAVETPSMFLAVFVGVVTGVGGGVLRDVLAGHTPYIFVKHFYATASLIGAVLCALLYNVFGRAAAIFSGAAAIVALRLMAAAFCWSLPKIKNDTGNAENKDEQYQKAL